ncbi:peptidoglycan-associated lipoprotein [Algicella marina]|uniref:Peptidoglycan-associated lipoprotein n=1 Tax=Algicella marina TaxID=2683284 RepID=A0A6P1T2Q2_9RHOB|nr:OmpA family protein [Algicella marina]QHQ37214.1 OmpA family protein [Algicella marina]
MKTTRILLVGMVLALAACSRGEDAGGLFGNGGGSLDDNFGTGAGTVLGPDGRPIDPNSPAYFTQVIGDRVLFPVDQHLLTAEARTTLDQQATWLLAHPGGQITIEGHADEQGTRDYNIALSNRRAAAVRDYLVTKGLPDSRLTIIPFGKERPIEVCSQESCYAKNRRAVTVVSGFPGA